MNADVQDLYQNTLDSLTKAALNMVQTVCTRYIRPLYFMSNSDGKLECETPPDLAKALREYSEALETLGVLRMQHTCDTAEIVKGNLIVDCHTTKVHCHAGKVFPSFTVRLVLPLNDGVWQVAKSNVAQGGANWNGLLLMRTTTPNERKNETGKARGMLLQTVVDRAADLWRASKLSGAPGHLNWQNNQTRQMIRPR